jgi:hypothetical protein
MSRGLKYATVNLTIDLGQVCLLILHNNLKECIFFERRKRRDKERLSVAVLFCLREKKQVL